MLRGGARPSTLEQAKNLYNWVRDPAGGPPRRRCRLCGGAATSLILCPACHDDLVRDSGARRALPAAVDELWIPYAYRYPLQPLIHQMKFGRDLTLARGLGDLLAAYAMAHGLVGDATVLVPVPIGHARLWRRGFNQALELAKPLARLCRARIDNVSVYKPGRSRVQSRLDAAMRRSNARDAYRCRGSMEGADIVIVDDIVTTGATVAGVARVLRRAGAARVTVIALAGA